MGAAEARANLLEHYNDLYIIPKGNAIWRETLAGTPWVMLAWGYSEAGTWFNLHVHGKVNARNDYQITGAETKIRSSDMKQEIFLSGMEWTMISKTVKDVISRQVFKP